MKKEYMYAAISIFVWSTVATTTKLLLGNLNSMQILMVGNFFATTFLCVLNIATGRIKLLKTLRIRDFLRIFSLGFFGIFLYNLFLYSGIDRMLASQAFIINYLWPIMTVLFASIILKEKMTVRKAIAILLSFVGVVIVASDGSLQGFSAENISGALFCILAAVSYGLFSALNKKFGYDQFISMMLYYFTSFIIATGYVFLTKDYFTIGSVQIAGLAWVGICSSAVGYTCWALALRYGNTVKISNLAYITPFLSLVWTFLLLKEPFSVYSFLGLLIIVLGIFIQMKSGRKDIKAGNKQA